MQFKSKCVFNLDIYNNHIHNIGDDSQEPEGACVNHRFRNNIIDTSLTGVSIGPVTQGPTWVIRCLWTNILGTSIKWADNPAGHVLIYHNTSYISTAGFKPNEHHYADAKQRNAQ